MQVHSAKMQPSAIIPTLVCLQRALPGNPNRNLFSNATARAPAGANRSTAVSPRKQVTFGGNAYTKKRCSIVYNISNQDIHTSTGALLVSGANVLLISLSITFLYAMLRL